MIVGDMEPAQNIPPISPDGAHPLPEVAGIQAQLEAAGQLKKAEAASAAPEMPGSVQAASAAADNAAANATQAANDAVVVPAAGPSTPLHADSPVIADDNDLIEQEWVDKAKAIVERTREDPYLQNKEINKFKADYIKKRYKKEIKVNEA